MYIIFPLKVLGVVLHLSFRSPTSTTSGVLLWLW